MNLNRVRDIIIRLIKENRFELLTSELTLEERTYFLNSYYREIPHDDEFTKVISGFDNERARAFIGHFFTDEESKNILDNNLLNEDLLPMALLGLKSKKDIDKYLYSFSNDVSKMAIVDSVKLLGDDIILEYLNNDVFLASQYKCSLMICLEDEKNKVDALYTYGNVMEGGDLEIVIEQLKEEKDKDEMIRRYAYRIDSNITAQLVYNSLNDDLKTWFIETYSDKIPSTTIADLIVSYRDDNRKLEMFDKYKDVISTRNYVKLVSSLKDDNIKLDIINENINKWKDYYIGDVLVSIKDDQIKIGFLDKYSRMFNAHDLALIISSIHDNNLIFEQIDKNIDYIKDELHYVFEYAFDDKLKVEAMEKYDTFIRNVLDTIISSIIDDKLKCDVLFDYAPRMDEYSIKNVIESIDDDNLKLNALIQNSHYFSEDICRDLLHSFRDDEYFYKGLAALDKSSMSLYIKPEHFYMIEGKESVKLFDRINEIVSLLDERKPSVSNLNALIGMQAKMNFEKLRREDPGAFLPADLAEQLSLLSKNKNLDSALLDHEFVEKYYKMVDLISSSCDTKVIANFLVEFNKKKKLGEEDFLRLLLGKLNVKEMQIGNTKKSDLLDTYTRVIKDILEYEGLSISSLYSGDKDNLSKANEISRLFEMATKKVMREAFESENKKEGGLLTQLSIYSLNLEREKWILNEKNLLGKDTKKYLFITSKSKENINNRRVIEIINEKEELSKIFNDSSLKYNDKMEKIFNIIDPSYKGSYNLQELYNLLLDSDEYKDRLGRSITDEEIDSIPLKSENFVIDTKAQKEKVITAIFNAISRDLNMIGPDELDSVVKERLDVIEANLKSMIKDSDQTMELLSYDSLDEAKLSNLENLLLYYSATKDYLPPKDKDGNNKAFNIDNLSDYISNINRFALRHSKYYSVLGETVINELEQRYINDNYNHYVSNVSKRYYRTIPDIKGTFKSDDRKLSFKSYDVTDPEQLIAGARMTARYQKSCFQIDHAQSKTMEYITSSPNGIIVAVNDEQGNFMGRVYGYRKGNAVHFTRFYYNEPFDFKEAIEKISEDIIKKSKEIDYVTCIPYTGNRIMYMDKNKMFMPDDIDRTQEDGKKMNTDHASFEYIDVVASRFPIDDINNVRFENEEPKEEYYKERSGIRTVIVDKTKDILLSDEYRKALSIIYCSNCDKKIIDILCSANRIVYGEDFVIIDFDGREPSIIKLDYNDAKYDGIVFNEINEALEMLKNKDLQTERGVK